MTTPDAEWISLGAALDLVVCFETDKRGHETATAEILRASQTHILFSTYVLINIGNLKTIKIGRRTLVTVDSLRALVDGQLGGA